MMFGGHHPIFGCIDHRLSPTQAPFARTAPERTAWDAQRGPIKEVWEWKARTLCVGVSRRAVCTFTATKQCAEFLPLRDRCLRALAVPELPIPLARGAAATRCNRQRPFFVAGDRQGFLLLVRAKSDPYSRGEPLEPPS